MIRLVQERIAITATLSGTPVSDNVTASADLYLAYFMALYIEVFMY